VFPKFDPPHLTVSHADRCRVALQAQRVGPPLIERRKSLYFLTQSRRLRSSVNRGYVALAVAAEQGTVSKELDTDCGKDRSANMVAFAVQALRLVKAVMVGEAKI
jgi:hypothetical protein